MDEIRKREKVLESKELKVIGESKGESKYIETLMKIQCESRWSDYDNEVFIVPSKWLNSWKAHIHFKDKEPGPISCKDLMLDREEYYHSLDGESQFDWILKETVKEEKDYYITSREIWEELNNLYGGERAIRYRQHKVIDLKLSKVAPLIILDHYNIHNQRSITL